MYGLNGNAPYHPAGTTFKNFAVAEDNASGLAGRMSTQNFANGRHISATFVRRTGRIAPGGLQHRGL
jgi:hypothetical protein